ncbi:MAG: SDR family oxidoreductase [Anaerolineales bacterium]
MDLQIKDKRAFLAGSSQGLGYAAAKALAKEGCRVAINGRTESTLMEAAHTLAEETGVDVYAIPGDVGDPEQAGPIIQQAVDTLGGLDLLLTNAGGPPAGAFTSFAEDTWQRAIDLSFMSHVRLIKAALPFLKESPIASVLTVTSYSVKQPIPNLVLSNSIRSATIGLTKTLALELGGEGIRFNSILPGWTKTDRVIELMSHRAEQNGTTIEEEIRKQAQDSALGRMGTPEEFGQVAAFLLSPAASYITGTMLPVEGGLYKGTF